MPRRSRRALMLGVLLGAASIAVALLALSAFDHVLGIVSPELALPPHERVHYRTAEFDYEVDTNSWGFRDREFGARRGADHRVLALGDSFTYGWGVALADTWVKVLEQNLRGRGLSVEVANLGVPGADPNKYAEIAARAVPALEPDLVIVGVLQGDDLAQMSGYEGTECVPPRPSSLRALVQRAFPNLSERVRPSPLGEAVSAEWKREATQEVDRATPLERQRFQGIAAPAQRAFLDGQLNPMILMTALRSPDFFMVTMQPGPRRQVLIDRMAACLQRIRSLAAANGARVVVLSVPHAPYASRRGFESARALGLQLDESVQRSHEMDEAIRQAATAAGLPFVSATDRFRAAPPDPLLFYEFDTHLTPAGHRLFADSITPAIGDAVRASAPLTQHASHP